jgi:hypothetical protein
MYPTGARAKALFRSLFFFIFSCIPGADVNFQPSITSLCTCAHHENGFIHESAETSLAGAKVVRPRVENTYTTRLSISWRLDAACVRENERRRLSERERERERETLAHGAGGFSLMPRRIGFGRVDTFIDNFWRENAE